VDTRTSAHILQLLKVNIENCSKLMAIYGAGTIRGVAGFKASPKDGQLRRIH
jgi:hypothetical protein